MCTFAHPGGTFPLCCFHVQLPMCSTRGHDPACTPADSPSSHRGSSRLPWRPWQALLLSVCLFESPCDRPSSRPAVLLLQVMPQPCTWLTTCWTCPWHALLHLWSSPAGMPPCPAWSLTPRVSLPDPSSRHLESHSLATPPSTITPASSSYS